MTEVEVVRFDPEKHYRRTLRLKGYDYAGQGAYFVTICSQNRENLFGEIAEGFMRVNSAGEMVQSVWETIPVNYEGVDVDAFVVMPNHIHGIIWLHPHDEGAAPRTCPNPRQPHRIAPTMSFPDVMHRFKSFTTTRYRHGVIENGWRPFRDKLWQRNYYEHIIRSESELDTIRQYIEDNPAGWQMDRENPESRPPKREFAWQV